MVVPLIALALLNQGRTFTVTELNEKGGGAARLAIQQWNERLDTPKFTPKLFGDPPAKWEFDFATLGLVRLRTTDENFTPRFRVYEQEHKEKEDVAFQVTRTLLRLNDHNRLKWQLDHKQSINGGLVDVYLCWGGKAGGEQLLDTEVVNGHGYTVNTIYIYDLESFTDPVEKVREVAHEYGHAALPAVGGFKEPEDWANGYLGEKLYLTMLRDKLADGSITPECTMGATKTQLDAWLAKNVEPLVTHASTFGPEPAILKKTGQEAMDNYMGLALYASAILPTQVFARSMKLVGSVKAADYPAAIELASVEPDAYRLTIPTYLKGRAIWIPLGKGAVSGATVTKRQGFWAQIQPGNGPVTVVPKHPPVG